MSQHELLYAIIVSLVPNRVQHVLIVLPLSSQKNIKPIFLFPHSFVLYKFNGSVSIESHDIPLQWKFPGLRFQAIPSDPISLTHTVIKDESVYEI